MAENGLDGFVVNPERVQVGCESAAEIVPAVPVGRELSRLNSWPSITAINRAHERQEATGDFGKDMTALIDTWQVVQDESVDFQGN